MLTRDRQRSNMAQAQPLADDDPTSSYMLQAGARICKCLGEEFLPYMQVRQSVLHDPPFASSDCLRLRNT